MVFDGTMTWAPFVQQTIAMVRDQRHNYKRGPGFWVDDEGNGYERYNFQVSLLGACSSDVNFASIH